MKRYFKNRYLAIFYITGFILILLAVSKPFTQKRSQYLNNGSKMTHRQVHKSQSSNNEHQTTHLQAQEFQFKSQVKFTASILTNLDRYTESINHDNNGAFDIIITKQDDTTKYFFRISSLPKQQCESNTTRACQQGTAAQPARGNIADIQIVLPGRELRPGIYQFGNGSSIPREDVMIYSRQLYSDPSHGRLGCQVWGKGSLTVEKAVYDVNGKLEYLEASLFRVCDRTAPFPPIPPEDNLLQVEGENIEQYTYYASWRCQLKVADYL